MPSSSDRRAETETIFNRLRLVLAEANVVLRALSMGGTPVPVDLVERVDSVTGTEYTEIVTGLPLEPADDEPD